MSRPDKDLAIIVAILQRLENYRLLAALMLQEKVDLREVLKGV